MRRSVNERILRIQDRRGQVAMASGKLVNLQEKLTCPICLELLAEPFSLDCGQSFCQACNTANNKESMIGLDGERRCPVFRIKYEPGNLWPHWHLANGVAPGGQGEKSGEAGEKSGEAREKSVCAMKRNSCSSVRRMTRPFAGFGSGLRNTVVTTHSSWRRLPRKTR